MKSIKAIVAGTAFIVITMLVLQLAFVFVVVAYNALATDFPFLHDIAGSFRYIIGIPIFIATMFIGGYITANVANMTTSLKIRLHCFAVGLITAVGMIYPILETADITTTGIVVFILAIVATVAGGLYWQRDNVAVPDPG